MPHLIVRVELHDAIAANYAKLHTLMLSEGFGNLIRGVDGNVYQLPSAEYHSPESGNYTATSMRLYLQQRLAVLGVGYWLLVSATDDISWYLAPVK